MTQCSTAGILHTRIAKATIAAMIRARYSQQY
jgi:hypothetical protein